MIWKYFKMKMKVLEIKLDLISYLINFLNNEDIINLMLQLIQCLERVPIAENQEKAGRKDDKTTKNCQCEND